jgi:hypothetical protein
MPPLTGQSTSDESSAVSGASEGMPITATIPSLIFTRERPAYERRTAAVERRRVQAAREATRSASMLRPRKGSLAANLTVDTPVISACGERLAVRTGTTILLEVDVPMDGVVVNPLGAGCD